MVPKSWLEGGTASSEQSSAAASMVMEPSVDSSGVKVPLAAGTNERFITSPSSAPESIVNSAVPVNDSSGVLLPFATDNRMRSPSLFKTQDTETPTAPEQIPPASILENASGSEISISA